MASRWRVMGENSSSKITTIKTNCKTVINVDNRHQHHSNKVPTKSSPISYFLNISMTTNKSRAPNESNPKFRIKIPKLLAKTVKKKELLHQNNGTTTANPSQEVIDSKTKKWANPKKLLHINKVTSLFSSFKKPESSSVSPHNSSNVGRNIDEEHHQNPLTDEEGEGEEKEEIFNKSSYPGALEDSAESSSSFKSMTSSLFSLDINGDYPASPLSDFIHHPKENLETKEEEDDDDGDSVGFNGTCSSTFGLPFKASSSFKSFFNKKTSHLNFISKGSNTGGSNNSITRSEGGNEEIKEEEEEEEEEVHRKSCGYDQKRTWRNGITGMKMVNRKTKKESDDDKELWKKRILMGEKCKPLNLSEFVEPSPQTP